MATGMFSHIDPRVTLAQEREAERQRQVGINQMNAGTFLSNQTGATQANDASDWAAKQYHMDNDVDEFGIENLLGQYRGADAAAAYKQKQLAAFGGDIGHANARIQEDYKPFFQYQAFKRAEAESKDPWARAINMIPGIGLTLIGGPALGAAFGGGIGGAAAGGAIIGGANAAMNNGDVLKGALLGGATGGAGSYANTALGGGMLGATGAGAVGGGIRAGLTGGDIGQGMIQGGVGGGLGAAGNAITAEFAGSDPLLKLGAKFATNYAQKEIQQQLFAPNVPQRPQAPGTAPVQMAQNTQRAAPGMLNITPQQTADQLKMQQMKRILMQKGMLGFGR